MNSEKLLAHFREQALICEAYGSPFTARLIECFAADLEAGGPVADLAGAWAGNPRADVVALRLAGALHAGVLLGRDPALAALYPPARAEWRTEEVWPVARAFLERERAWVADFIRSPPQTNEVCRSIALLAGFLSAAQTWSGPVDILELGASAGLNLYWDRFRYETQSWSWGPASAVRIDTDWRAPAPPTNAALNLRARAACDLNPLDLSDEAAVLRLRAYIWPDQDVRLARFDGAVRLAREVGAIVERADAAEWIARKLGERARDALTIVYHSVFLQYPPRETRNAIIATIEAAGADATPEAPLIWVRLEPEALWERDSEALRFAIDMITWPGGDRRVLGYTDGHVRTVEAV